MRTKIRFLKKKNAYVLSVTKKNFFLIVVISSSKNIYSKNETTQRARERLLLFPFLCTSFFAIFIP